ncbi:MULTISPECIES: aspartate/glutamate racemase family protein [unclassified Francisella]|uniref:aspartate/glutamate racemase family protein n=1 Tax=unclassified Francisella TaxID=2610885 RepID=UPI002E36D9BC|nr:MULTISPECIES: aspartate/glutamate racemase family protein [unclassified Francisella]MED7819029.1 aspartate/glutamate racemase family protein [Francisella sp. 19S2-4]MED7829814.1 aspartate/glutamate racemase family protein [Francisella sp. 19S2-10]
MKKTKIRIITAFPVNEQNPTRTIDDIIHLESDSIELSISYNQCGAEYFNSDVEQFLSIGGVALEAQKAEKEGIDAVVIESGGDTGIEACRELVKIPVIGLSDVAFRVAGMLGRKFGLITADDWQGYATERVIHKYGLANKYCGEFKSIKSLPFWVDGEKNTSVLDKAYQAATVIIEKYNIDTIVFSGSYFFGFSEKLKDLLFKNGVGDIVIIEQMPLAINFAEAIVKSKLLHSKKIYASPKIQTNIHGYLNIHETPLSVVNDKSDVDKQI